jgi:hypothetical protein
MECVTGTGMAVGQAGAAGAQGGPGATGSQGASGMGARLAVVIVNWNGADDTIECLEALLRQSVRPRIIVVDNGSDDGSVARLVAWASGEAPYEPPAGPLRRLTNPPAVKPVKLRVLDAEAAGAEAPGTEDVTLIASADNLGFSAGNNLGLRHALLDPRISYCWCLNNDAVADPGAVGAIVARMDATHKVGMCGTQVRYYHRPGHWQALNGHRFSVLTGQSRGIGIGVPVTRPFDPKMVTRETDFVLGASLAVSRSFLETVGFMEEDYFLYFEEMDWAVRNRGRFATAFAQGAIIYHKEGGSIGSSTRKGQRSALSEYYLMRSRLKFYRRNFPLLWPLQYPLGFGLVARRLVRRQPDKAAAMLRAMFGMKRG